MVNLLWGEGDNELQNQLSGVQKEFECLTVKKQPHVVSVMNKKSLEVGTKKTSIQRRHTKLKIAEEKQTMHRKPKSSKREKTWKWVAQSGVKKKHRVHKQDPPAWEKTQATEIEKWKEIEPSRKKKKTQNVEKYFDDVPKKKMKVSRLMKFMDKNKEFVQLGDDFGISIGNRPIPGSDFIEIMHYLQKKWGAKEQTFIPSRDPWTGMPIGMKQFIDALHKAIKGESIPGNMSKEAVNKFAKNSVNLWDWNWMDSKK